MYRERERESESADPRDVQETDSTDQQERREGVDQLWFPAALSYFFIPETWDGIAHNVIREPHTCLFFF